MSASLNASSDKYRAEDPRAGTFDTLTVLNLQPLVFVPGGMPSTGTDMSASSSLSASLASCNGSRICSLRIRMLPHPR